ncbi:hypothetical protein H6F67_02900 [Microcoleus sp. FACHB-1515]|uniref:hypothetical protein n=1 Tax=Cyanophyceae TaxID=3028117 RepID=UPI0016823DC2|nr:hypothetical protein [Microcoleus sp. FACHB-1515]MBD2088810.1 hypothetical protein [Microcoleus sp. FACHB-1515]
MLRRNVQLMQPLLAEFRAACVELGLKLPASTPQIDRQVAQILTARGRLAKLHRQIQRYLIREMPPPMRQQLHTLLHSTSDLLQLADSLVFLAEEYPLDPEGSIACSRRLHLHKINVLAQMQRSLPLAIDTNAIGS